MRVGHLQHIGPFFLRDPLSPQPVVRPVAEVAEPAGSPPWRRARRTMSVTSGGSRALCGRTVRVRTGLGRLDRPRRKAKLLFQRAPFALGPAVDAGDPAGGARIDPAVECFVALPELLPFQPGEA